MIMMAAKDDAGDIEEKGLIAAVQAILRRWDPLGVKPGVEGPGGQYDEHALMILSSVLHGASHARLSRQLSALSVKITGNPASQERDSRIAKEILSVLGW